jgi:hypothetical protein
LPVKLAKFETLYNRNGTKTQKKKTKKKEKGEMSISERTLASFPSSQLLFISRQKATPATGHAILQ